MDRRSVVALVACLLVVGCSKDEADPKFPDPESVTFEYGSPSDASSGSDPAAVTSAVATARALVGQTDMANRPEGLVALILLPRVLEQGHSWDPDLANLSSCFEVTPTTLRWSGCQVSWAENGFHQGTFSGTLTYSASSIAWDASMDLLETVAKFHSNAQERLHGELLIGVDGVKGFVRSNELVQSYGPGGRDDGSSTWTKHVALALTFDGSGCPVGGTVETKFLSGDFASGALYTWSGCGTVNRATASR